MGISVMADTSSIGILAPNCAVPEHSGTGLCPLIPVPNCRTVVWHWHFCSFRYRTDCMDAGKSDSLALQHLKNLYISHQHFYCQSTASAQHLHSGIKVSPIPLVTEKFAIAHCLAMLMLC
jgi:hypothetical protein